jgi:hypothetical protein
LGFNKLRHITIFVLPLEYIPIFISNGRLRLLKEQIEIDSQSNVIFAPICSALPCFKDIKLLNNIVPSYEESVMCKKAITSALYSWKIPFLIDDYNYTVYKKCCDVCDPAEFICHDAFQLEVASVPSDVALLQLSKIINSNISLWHIRRDNIKGDDLRCLSYLNGLFYEIEPDKLLLASKFRIYSGFIKDIRDNPHVNFSNIAFSMLRAIAYPSSKAPDRHKYSLDWHSNDPATIDGYDLIRVDVLGPSRSGITGSGAERLLIAKKSEAIYYLSYTSTHDFTPSSIRGRLHDINNNQQHVWE